MPASDGRIIGLVASTFDLLHAGHVVYLERARSMCDELVACLQASTEDRPEKNSPVQSVYERWKQLSAVRYVDRVIPYDTEADLENLLMCTPHDVRFLGTDYADRGYTGKWMYLDTFVDRAPRTSKYPYTVMLSRLHGYSTSDLRARVAKVEKESWGIV